MINILFISVIRIGKIKSNVMSYSSIIKYFFYICCFCILSCKNSNEWCYDIDKPKIDFDSIIYKVHQRDIIQFKGWSVIRRQYDVLWISSDDTITGIKDFSIMYYLENCKFKSLATQNIFSVSDSNSYRNEISVNKVLYAYQLIDFYSNLQVSNIEWQKHNNRIHLSLGENPSRDIHYDLKSFNWVK